MDEVGGQPAAGIRKWILPAGGKQRLPPGQSHQDNTAAGMEVTVMRQVMVVKGWTRYISSAIKNNC